MRLLVLHPARRHAFGHGRLLLSNKVPKKGSVRERQARRRGATVIKSADEREHIMRWLILAAQGDQQAFAELYRATSPMLFGICVRMIRDRSEAEDVLQETYTTIWRRASSFDPAQGSALTWLTTLARNKAIDRLRQHRDSQLNDAIDLEQVIDEQPGPANGAQSTEEYRRLQACLELLEPKQRRSVREAFFTGATYNELALRCNVPLGTMKSWIRRSLLQLRTCLDS